VRLVRDKVPMGRGPVQNEVLVKRKADDFVGEWKEFYKQVLDVDVDFSHLHIPKRSKGFNWMKHRGFGWLIVVRQGLTAQKLFDICWDRFSCWKWTNEDLDKILDQARSVRDPANGTYAVWVRNRDEADEEHKKKSADQIQKEATNTVTLEERLLLELFFHWKRTKRMRSDWLSPSAGERERLFYSYARSKRKETKENQHVPGEFLDIHSMTLCSGSRYSNGEVPRVYNSRYGKFSVDSYHPRYSSDFIRAREVIA
jgi:hypothetical protein